MSGGEEEGADEEDAKIRRMQIAVRSEFASTDIAAARMSVRTQSGL